MTRWRSAPFPSAPLAGQPATLTATVTPLAPATGIPTGTVTFVDSSSGTYIGSAALSGGIASISMPPIESAGVHTIAATYSGDGGFDATSDQTSLAVVEITAPTSSAHLSSTAPFTIEGNSSSAASIYEAVSGLSSAPAGSVLVINLGAEPYSEITLSPPAGLTVIINASNGGFVYGGSPALTVTSGTVIVNNASFISTTNAPTILVTGGSLTLRHDIVQESPTYNQAAIRITGGKPTWAPQPTRAKIPSMSTVPGQPSTIPAPTRCRPWAIFSRSTACRRSMPPPCSSSCCARLDRQRDAAPAAGQTTLFYEFAANGAASQRRCFRSPRSSPIYWTRQSWPCTMPTATIWDRTIRDPITSSRKRSFPAISWRGRSISWACF